MAEESQNLGKNLQGKKIAEKIIYMEVPVVRTVKTE